jgi:hypothetical protein
MVDKLESV